MGLGNVPRDAFFNPDGSGADSLRDVVDKVLESLMVVVRERAGQSPLPRSVESHYEAFPQEGHGYDDVFARLSGVLQDSLYPAHPGYIGHMDSIPTLMSVIGDFVAAFLNNNLLSQEMSPALSMMETDVLRQFGQKFGLGENSGGVMTSGGTLANLQALALARNRAFSVRDEGLARLGKRPVLFASEVAHTSLQKAAMLLGLGSSAVVPVRADANSRMRPDDLEEKIRNAKACGEAPFAVVATAGTTVTGNIDPLREIGALAKQYGLWFHVDAAYGGGLIFSPTQRFRLQGIEQADSVTFNPQKWMYIAKTCAMVLFKDTDLLLSDFRVAAPYMSDSDFVNLGEISVQGTRHADILKLWLSLCHIGLVGYQQLVDHSYATTAFFVDQIRARSYLVLAGEPETNLCCFRGEPSFLPQDAWDEWNVELQRHLSQRGQTFLSCPGYRGGRWLRAVLLNPFTTTEVIDGVFRAMDEFYQASAAARG